MTVLLVAFLVSMLVSLLIVRVTRWRSGPSPRPRTGPQNFHVNHAPRLGGLAVVTGLVGAFATLPAGHPLWHSPGPLIMGASLPCLLAGLAEDVRGTQSPLRRLLATALSAGVALVLLDAPIRDTDIPGLDWLVSFTTGSMVLTVFTVTGMANAINIIDGFNGLASMCVAIMLAGLAYVAFQVGDSTLSWLALAGVGTVMGFFIWNFPGGLIFLGDGGAYFLGFYVAELALLLIARNPAVSPLFPLLLCFYPVFETLFSIYRRRVLHLRSVGMPDGAHLHSLIYRRLLRWAAGQSTARELTRRNSMTSPYLWGMCMLSAAPAVLFWDNSALIGLSLAAFSGAYLALYWRIVRFRSPRLLRPFAPRRRSREARQREASDNSGT